MGIGCPTVFLPLRAVGGDAVDVVEIGLHRSVPYLVEEGQGAAEVTDGLQIGMHKEGSEALFGQFDRSIAFYLCVLEAVVGKGGHKGLFALTTQDVLIHLEDFPWFHGVVIDIDVALLQTAIRFQQLAVTDLDARALLALDLQAAESGDVLRIGIDIELVAEPLHGGGLQLLGDVNARHGLCGQLRCGLLDPLGLFPVCIVEGSGFPALFLQLCVETVATVYIIIGIATGSAFPSLVRAYGFRRSIRIGQAQLATQRGTASPSCLMEVPDSDRLLVVPAITQHGGQSVIALLQQIRHVVGDVKDAFAKVGITGIEVILAYTLTIDEQLVITRGGDIETCLLKCLCQLEGFTEKGSRLELLVLAIGDPLRLPIGFGELGRLETGDSGRSTQSSLFIPYLDGPVVTGMRLEGCSLGVRL